LLLRNMLRWCKRGFSQHCSNLRTTVEDRSLLCLSSRLAHWGVSLNALYKYKLDKNNIEYYNKWSRKHCWIEHNDELIVTLCLRKEESKGMKGMEGNQKGYRTKVR